MTRFRNPLALTLIAAALAAGGTAFAQQTPPAATPPTTTASPQAVHPRDLLTTEERETFRRQMREAATPEDREQVRAAQRAMVEQRARDKGVTLAAPGRVGGHLPGHRPGKSGDDGPMGQLFTPAERDQMRSRMQAAQTAEARQQVRGEYRALAETRAKEKGITLPPRGERGARADGPRAELFTPAERDGFRTRMQAAQTVEERMKVRDDKRTLAELRAREKGITLPPHGPGHHGPRGPRGTPDGTTPPPASAPQS
jgi:hypothetical protein